MQRGFSHASAVAETAYAGLQVRCLQQRLLAVWVALLRELLQQQVLGQLIF
jgi:hypothetical protein